jgi:hypothetical protein
MALLRFSFVLSTALSCAMLLESGGPVSDTNARPNACLYYLHALVLMPRLEDLSEREKQTIDNWSSAPVDRSAAGLVAKYTEALAYYRRGASMSEADWGLDAVLAQLGPAADGHIGTRARVLYKIVGISARSHYDSRDEREAFRDLIANIAFARHLRQVGTIGSLRLSFVIESETLETIAGMLKRREDAQLLKSILESSKLPPMRSVAEAIKSEGRSYVAWIKQHGFAAIESLIPDFWNADEAKKEALRAQLGLKKLQLDEVLSALSTAFDSTSQLAAMRLEEIPQAEKQFKIQLEKRQESILLTVLPRLILPSPSALRRLEENRRLRMQLLTVGIEYLSKGPKESTSSEFKDPISGEPIVIRKQDGSIEVRSRLGGKDGEPLLLIFGGKSK